MNLVQLCIEPTKYIYPSRIQTQTLQMINMFTSMRLNTQPIKQNSWRLLTTIKSDIYESMTGAIR